MTETLIRHLVCEQSLDTVRLRKRDVRAQRAPRDRMTSSRELSIKQFPLLWLLLDRIRKEQKERARSLTASVHVVRALA